MKILMIIVLLSLVSCVSAPCPVSPPEDVIILTTEGPVKIEKGMMSSAENYYTMSEWDEFMKSYYNSLNPTNNM